METILWYKGKNEKPYTILMYKAFQHELKSRKSVLIPNLQTVGQQ